MLRRSQDVLVFNSFQKHCIKIANDKDHSGGGGAGGGGGGSIDVQHKFDMKYFDTKQFGD
jgi:hypothetical protein